MASVKSPYDSAVVVEYPDGSISLEPLKEEVAITEDDLNYTVKEGDTLQGIANTYYKDSGLWYIIALANNIQNPFDINQFYPDLLIRIPQYGGN